MLFTVLFLIELIILFILSKSVTQLLSHLFYRITKSRAMTINAMAILYFPGTLFHELSHALMAALLFVPIGHIELFPKIEGDQVKLGTVEIAHTDPFRRFLIGTAPFLFGTLFILGVLFFATTNNLFDNVLFIILIGYLVFEIGNTMFSSKKDMEGAIELLIVVAIFAVIFFFLGFRISFSPGVLLDNPTVQQVLQTGSLFLFIPLSIDILLFFLLRFVMRKFH
jgi:hypothetical protein